MLEFLLWLGVVWLLGSLGVSLLWLVGLTLLVLAVGLLLGLLSLAFHLLPWLLLAGLIWWGWPGRRPRDCR